VSVNRKQTIFLISVGTVIAVLIGGGILLLARNDERDREGLQVVTTFYPLYYLASQIGGDKASVSMLIPENMEPHAWEPKVSDILSVDRADVFIYNGGGLEPWVEDFIGSSMNGDIVIVDTGKGVAQNRSEDHEEETGHDHGSLDPHFWLDPLSAKVQVDNVLVGYTEGDPENAPYYEANAISLKEKLDDLHHDFEAGLQNRTKNDIVTTHEGFNYLADRYGFRTHAAVGISGDEQPSVQDMTDLIAIMEDMALDCVFVEPTFSDRYMETIAEETGANVLVLDGVHGRTGVHSDMDYFQIMRENLRNLMIGLGVVEGEGR
jgi:zinc transport system substrate-binding protein